MCFGTIAQQEVPTPTQAAPSTPAAPGFSPSPENNLRMFRANVEIMMERLAIGDNPTSIVVTGNPLDLYNDSKLVAEWDETAKVTDANTEFRNDVGNAPPYKVRITFETINL